MSANTTPATLPDAVVTWLTSPGSDDVSVSVEALGEGLPLELVARRGSWEICFAIDGHTAGLEYRGRGACSGDMGDGWFFDVRDLAALLADPRVEAHIAQSRAVGMARILGAALAPVVVEGVER